VTKNGRDKVLKVKVPTARQEAEKKGFWNKFDRKGNRETWVPRRQRGGEGGERVCHGLSQQISGSEKKGGTYPRSGVGGLQKTQKKK